jgi:hypothetical protein
MAWYLVKHRDSFTLFFTFIALGYGLDDGGLGFDPWRGLRIFLFTTASRTALGPTWVPGLFSWR